MTTFVTDLSTPAADCTHFWVIDPPSGPLSKALCLKCGGESLKENSIREEQRVNNNDIYTRGPSGSRRTYNDDRRSNGNDVDPFANRRTQRPGQWDPLDTD